MVDVRLLVDVSFVMGDQLSQDGKTPAVGVQQFMYGPSS
jgi:hypothetical protein